MSDNITEHITVDPYTAVDPFPFVPRWDPFITFYILGATGLIIILFSLYLMVKKRRAQKNGD